jgi:hypothetical protein
LHLDAPSGSIELVFGDDGIRNGFASLAAEDRSTWSAPARLARLVELRTAQERLDAEVLQAVAECDAVNAWEVDCLGGVSWLASKLGLVRHTAARLLRTARFTARHAQTAKALDAMPPSRSSGAPSRCPPPRTAPRCLASSTPRRPR